MCVCVFLMSVEQQRFFLYPVRLRSFRLCFIISHRNGRDTHTYIYAVVSGKGRHQKRVALFAFAHSFGLLRIMCAGRNDGSRTLGKKEEKSLIAYIHIHTHTNIHNACSVPFSLDRNACVLAGLCVCAWCECIKQTLQIEGVEVCVRVCVCVCAMLQSIRF